MEWGASSIVAEWALVLVVSRLTWRVMPLGIGVSAVDSRVVGVL